jgi:glycosyltransferase involved in cell wall biosynthesis
MARPRASVVIPTFNRLEWLPESVRSVQEQTVTEWELLLVDDGSTDDTERWARSLGDPRVRYIRRDHSGSIAATRNAGMREARGEWMAFLDSDDRWRPDKLARQFARLREAPDARWCYTRYQLIDRRGGAVAQPFGGPWQPFEDWFVDRILTTEAAVPVQTLLAPTDLARELAFDERIPLVDDYDFVLRLAATARGCVVDEILAEIRMHDERTTSLAGVFDGHFGKVIAYRKAARAMPDRRLRRVARRQLRSHLGAFLRQALRRGAVGEIVRVTSALRRA